MGFDELTDHVDSVWDDDVVPTLHEYITIPNLSEAFDPDWATNGHMAAAVELFASWARSRPIEGMTVDVVELEGCTPVLVCEIPAHRAAVSEHTVLLYGHLDKQPEMEGWDDNKGPWTPVLEDGRLYGRGGGDDGYAMFASLTAVEALVASGGIHARLVVLIEAGEESGSPDLAAHVDNLADRLGDVGLVVCLDSGAADYEALWVTTSLRGLVSGVLEVEVAEQGMHSGSASGVVPSSFRILRNLIDRVEDCGSGRIRLPELHAEIPDDIRSKAEAAAPLLAHELVGALPLAGSTRPVEEDVVELILNRTWRPALSVVGLGGAPEPGDAGNVLRPRTSAKLSFRLPPTTNPTLALEAVTRALTDRVPYGATATFADAESGPGWAAPPFEPWLADVLDDSSERHFGRPAGYQGEGGSIPFMGMLGTKFPTAQFVITGVLGPGSNAHGPNEFLDIATAKRVTGCVAEMLAAHAVQGS
ncbi:MAG: M20/M25/M40 family metallo-hydrolase [Actinomycetia bacterium]|nr:M20/M25/M40 family metallo-hydrolase [Actinomycetes bacterium]MCP4960981.1 M20/M25/M40 family metallo-hydrolase [Actinomycetes bacterium]